MNNLIDYINTKVYYTITKHRKNKMKNITKTELNNICGAVGDYRNYNCYCAIKATNYVPSPASPDGKLYDAGIKSVVQFQRCLNSSEKNELFPKFLADCKESCKDVLDVNIGLSGSIVMTEKECNN